MKRHLLVVATLILLLAALALAPVAAAQPPSDVVELVVVTGTDGTENPLLVQLFGPNSGNVPLWVIVMAEGTGDLQPGMTNSYVFSVPYDFCDLTRLHISKPASIPYGDDAWDIREMYIRIDGVEVAFDRVAYETFSPMTYDSWPANLEWSGTAQYQAACSGGGATSPFVTPQVVIPVATVVQLQPLQPVVPVVPVVTVVPIQPIQPVQPIQPIAPIQPQLRTRFSCAGFNLQPRLQINGNARVLPGLPNNLRAEPSAASAAVGQIPGGAAFAVIGGPRCSDGIVYWLVEYNGVQGWTGEGQGSSFWVEPIN